MVDSGSKTDAEVILVQCASSSGPMESVVDEWRAFKCNNDEIRSVFKLNSGTVAKQVVGNARFVLVLYGFKSWIN